MALPPLKSKTPSKLGLPPLKPRIPAPPTGTTEAHAFAQQAASRVTPTAAKLLYSNVRTIEEEQTVSLKKGDSVKFDITKLNPKGVFRLATDVIEQKGSDLVLLEWDDPFDHMSCNKRHAWARIEDVEPVK